jgi:ABC-type sugar transport system substrate-binding protein
MRIVFLNPASDADPFYKKMVQFARLAAADLEVEFEVIEARRDMELMRQLALDLINATDRPDYLILVNDRNLAADLLPQITGAGLQTFIVCEGFFVAERNILGRPREKHPNWLASLLPDDDQAGELLAETLIEAAREQQLVADDGQIHIIGLSGAYSIGAILRLNGLRRVMARHPDVVLDEVAPALWEYETAARLTPELLERNPRGRVFWAANDDMALGAAQAVEAAGRRPGTDTLVGGIDWSAAVLEKISEGVFTGSVGGHFLDCGWSLVMLHDHYHGHDFGASVALSKYVALTKQNSSRYGLFFDEALWPSIRFSRFSKARNPGLEEYDFGLEAILASL